MRYSGLVPRNRRRRAEVRLSDRSPKERHRAQNILDGSPSAGDAVEYDPEYHPADLVEFFRSRFEDVVDAIENVNDKGDLKFVPKPARPPTFAGYAAKIGAARETLWRWSKRHTEFAEAVDQAKAIQEAFLVELGAIGGLNAQMTMFALKNLQGWSEKADLDVHGHVELSFDSQDAEA